MEKRCFLRGDCRAGWMDGILHQCLRHSHRTERWCLKQSVSFIDVQFSPAVCEVGRRLFLFADGHDAVTVQSSPPARPTSLYPPRRHSTRPTVSSSWQASLFHRGCRRPAENRPSMMETMTAMTPCNCLYYVFPSLRCRVRLSDVMRQCASMHISVTLARTLSRAI